MPGKLLYRYPLGVIVMILGLSLYFASLLPNLKVSLDFSNYFPSESPELDFYEDYLEIFGSKNDILSIGVYRSEGVYDSVFLRKVDALGDSCLSLPHVSKVTSLTRLSLPRKIGLGVVNQRLLRLNNSKLIARDSAKISQYPLFLDRFVSKDGTTFILALHLNHDRSLEDSEELISSLDKLLVSFAFEEAHIVGTADLEARYVWESEKELKRFVVLSLTLIIIVLSIVYRSLSVVLLSLGCFLLSLIFLGGFLVLADQELDIMAPMIPSIILIVSISDVIHILSHYSKPASEGSERIASINQVVKTNFLTSLTTALGFFTLMLSPMPMLYFFGLFVGLGVLFAYIVSILLVPAVLFLFRSAPKEPQGIFSSERWKLVAEKLDEIGRKQSATILLTSLVLVLISFGGMSIINTNRTIASPMPAQSPVAKAFHFFDKHLAGARDFELAVYAKKQGGLSKLENLREIKKIHHYLDSLPEVGALSSPVSYYEWLNSFNHGMSPRHLSLPESDEVLMFQELTVPHKLKQQFRAVLDSTRSHGAIRGRMPDMGTRKSRLLLDSIDQWIATHVDTQAFVLHHTGTPLILDQVNEIQIKAMFKGLGIAIISISLIIALLFYDWRMVVITLLINLVPLVIVAGLMGFLGIELRGGTSIVFSIAFVLAVDDTIHFLNNFFFKRRRDLSQDQAILQTLWRTGQPIMISSLVIFLAFVLMASSHFGNVKYLGILVSLAAVFALLSDLFLAPVLLRLITKKK